MRTCLALVLSAVLSATALVSTQSKTVRVRVQTELPADLPLVDGDYTQLELVVTNLLENASRHAPPGSIVRIGGRRIVDRGQVEVWVSDEGIGVPDYERQRVFEPFHRGEGSRSSGVGLAICKAVVEAHGGSIRADRTPGGGATFAFTLPKRRTLASRRSMTLTRSPYTAPGASRLTACCARPARSGTPVAAWNCAGVI